MSGKIVSFCSYKGGAGRTTTAVNTAYQLALMDKSVVVVDLDVEGPGIGSILEIDDDFLDQKDLRKYFSIEARQAQEPVSKYVITKEFFDDDDNKLSEFDVFGASMKSDKKTISTDEDGALHVHFRGMVNELVAEYDYVIFDAASGIADLSVLAYAHTHMGVVCFRWSKQHFKGAMKMLGMMIKMLHQGEFTLEDFVPVANAVAQPKSASEKRIVNFVVETIGEQLSERLLNYSRDNDYPVPELQYVWEESELKFDDRVVLHDDEGGYSNYYSLARYIDGRLS